MQHDRQTNGFTVVELLVVITIIVVLLALLTPALDRAIYQAEMAADGANHKTIANSAAMYAAANSRAYPARPMADIGSGAEQMRSGDGAYDDRLYIEDYISFDALQCTFTDEMDIAPDEHHPDSWVHSSYNLYFGWQYAGHSGLKKLGQGFGATGVPMDDFGADPRTYKFSVISADYDTFGSNQDWVVGSHPDDTGVLGLSSLQDEIAPESSPMGTGLVGAQVVRSRWQNQGFGGRGAIDRQVSFADGSVERYLESEYENDERMIGIHARADRAGDAPPVVATYLPRP